MSVSLFARSSFCALLYFSFAATGWAQEEEAPAEKPKLPEIADEPRLIDPAALMPKKLAAKATVDLSGASLQELVDWLREEQKLVVLLERNALEDIGVLPGDPVSDRLDDAPIYLLLNRLQALGLAWYYEDEVLHITSAEEAEEHLTTVSYNVADLLGEEYDPDTLMDVITSLVAPQTWDTVGGAGTVNILGDVLFLRQTDQARREVQGLLAALRKPARQTLTLDPPQHTVLREKLEENASADFNETPLAEAVKNLAEQSGIEMRLDRRTLRDLGIRERHPVTLKITDRKLKTVLQALLLDLELTWILRDGVLWITSREVEEEFSKTAVYDVRDLCRDGAETEALVDAITMQAAADTWDTVGGPGSIDFYRPGVIIVSNKEATLMEVKSLLEKYRTALRESKPRQRAKEDPTEVITWYYRMHTDMAKDLAAELPNLVQPKTWRTKVNDKGIGSILRVASAPESEGGGADDLETEKNGEQALSPFSARSVLIIRQTRAAHDEIAEVIRRVSSGDYTALGQAGFGGGLGGGLGGGQGGGGFGGGFFSREPKPAGAQKSGQP